MACDRVDVGLEVCVMLAVTLPVSVNDDDADWLGDIVRDALRDCV